MSYTAKLLIPLVLGAAAAAINWTLLSSQTATVAFVKATARIEPGEMIDASALAEAVVLSEFAGLQATAVPASESGQVIGAIAQRRIEANDLVLWRDLPLRSNKPDVRPGEDLLFVKVGDAATVPQMLSIGRKIHFRVSTRQGSGQWVGPFRIVSVDARIDDDARAARAAPETITVAYPKNPATQTERDAIALLEDFCDRQTLESAQLLAVRVEVD